MRIPALTLALVLGSGCAAPATPSAHEAAAQPPPPPKVGDRVPAISLHRIDGKHEALGIVPGKVNLLFFFATWSGPSKQAMTRLPAILDRDGPRGFVAVAIAIDDESRGVAEFGKSYAPTLPVAWDENRVVTERFRLPGSEYFVVVDRTGIIRYLSFGYHEDEDKVIAAEIEKLL